jgi:hypothetical protein
MTKARALKARSPKPGQQDKSRVPVERGAAGKNGEWPATTFSQRKSIEELAAEQGTKPTRLEDILGKGADLWESDHELEKFLEDIYARRSVDRELAKQ